MSLNLAPLTLESPQPIAQLASVHGHSQAAQSSGHSYHLRNTFPINVLQCISGYLDDPTRALLIREGELPSSHTITKIVDTSHKILWKLPQGSPDYSTPYEEIDGQHLHFRTSYQQASLTCWLEVFQHILHGAHPVKPIPQEKSIDILRQEITYAEQEKASAVEFQQSILPHFPILKNNLPAEKGFIKALLKCRQKSMTATQRRVLDNFLKEADSMSFSNYVTNLLEKRQVEAFDKFFQKNHIQPLDHIPQQFLDEICEVRSITHEEIRKLPFEIQVRVANFLGVNAIRKFYQFPASSWDTRKDVSHLLEEVRMHGVIGFGGYFGKGHYSEKPHQVLEIDGHKIFGWRPETRIDTTVAHYIAVVGVIQEHRKEKIAQKKTGYVIYVDPNDKSDPKDPEQQQFYMVSYETFKDLVIDNLGLSFSDFEDLFLTPIKEVLNSPSKKNSPEYRTAIAMVSSLAYGRIPNPPYLKVEGKREGKEKLKPVKE